MYKKISDYGIIGDLHTVALVALDGSIDWLCFPHINSASVFGALLDDKKGGRFSVAPVGEYDSAAEYIHDTNILVTKFRKSSGELHLTDFMPIPPTGVEEREAKDHELYRLIEMKTGSMEVEIVFAPRFDYARVKPSLKHDGAVITAEGGDEKLTLTSTHPLEVEDCACRSRLSLKEGDRVWLKLKYGADTHEPPLDPQLAEKLLDDTRTYWKSWLNKSETGRSVDICCHQELINRSALVLKLLYYEKTGAIAAAATTSLPEVIGGERNWDYRFTWVRDASFTLQALFTLGHMSETEGYIRWIENLLCENGVEDLQIMYGLDGERDLPEEELTHLEGYKGSKPVRIGNSAAKQKQLDIYGELMDAALKLSDYVGKIDSKVWPFLRSICDHVVEHWHDRDNGIWEVRGGPYHFVYSKVMCWVALDRGIKIAHRYGFPCDLSLWDETKNKIGHEVLEKGWNSERGAFVQHYETDALDSSNLLIPIMGFLPYDDERVVSTLEATMLELSSDGFLYRYNTADGLKGGEGTFLLCTFWLINNLVHLKRFDEARELLMKVERVANHLGLFSEEYDFKYNEQLGNFPQAFTHIGYINSVIALCRVTGEAHNQQKEEERMHVVSNSFFAEKIVLNDGEPDLELPAHELAARLKSSMNVLRGAFFDLERGRIEYEKMHASDAYEEHVTLSYSLKNMDLNALTTREDKLAFWINLYNVIVIHGVIELVIKDSVKEARNFFKRIEYRVGEMLFCPDDIEHGILRGNATPPNSLFKRFKSHDERLAFSLAEIDPRIHFALVCGSSSCPPIEVYTAENIDAELKIAGESFINGGGAVLDRENSAISLSRIFKWYAHDFGKDQEERLTFIAQYLFKQEDRAYLIENAKKLKVTYQDYDWRLNKE